MNGEGTRCDACGQRTMDRTVRPYERHITHDGRPATIRIPDLEVIACTNPDCRPDDPNETMSLDDAALRRITVETYKQLGLLTPAEIREKRRALSLSQQRLQNLLGLGGNSLSRWEKGRVYQSRAMNTFLRTIFEVPEAVAFLQRRQGSDEGSLASNAPVALSVSCETGGDVSNNAEPDEDLPPIIPFPNLSEQARALFRKQSPSIDISLDASGAA